MLFCESLESVARGHADRALALGLGADQEGHERAGVAGDALHTLGGSSRRGNRRCALLLGPLCLSGWCSLRGGCGGLRGDTANFRVDPGHTSLSPNTICPVPRDWLTR